MPKKVDFKPDFIGQLQFSITAVNEALKKMRIAVVEFTRAMQAFQTRFLVRVVSFEIILRYSKTIRLKNNRAPNDNLVEE